jgi:hypothetical protein
MPTMQAMTEKANAVFNRQSIDQIPEAAKDSLGIKHRPLGEVCGDLGIATSAAERSYLSGRNPVQQGRSLEETPGQQATSSCLARRLSARIPEERAAGRDVAARIREAA